MFIDQEVSETVLSDIAYYRELQPPEYLKVLRRSVRLLDRSVASARGFKAPNPESAEAATVDLLVGLAMLAMSEARALLLLTSFGLERSARIHLRSLFEYTFRAGLVQDPKTASAFKAAAAVEVVKLLADLGREQTEEIEAAIARYTRGLDASEEPVREKRALGGDVRTLIEREFANDKGAYARSFSFPSLFSHGSIVALDEVSRHTEGRGRDFPQGIFRDGQGFRLLAMATAHVLELVIMLIKAFNVEVGDEWDALVAENEKLLRAGAPPNAGA